VWHYLKAAFLVRLDVPTLGRVPINVLLAAGFGILGVAEPGFWLAGLAVESAVLSSLAFNPRFQKYVQAQQLQEAKGADDQKRRNLIQTLTPEARRRIAGLSGTCAKVLDVYRSQQADEYVIDTNREALERLQWLFLKLLIARHHLVSAENAESEQSMTAKIQDLELDVKDEKQPDSLRESKSATIAILKKRLDNIQRKSQTLEEIESDCVRIEAQVNLLLENASMEGKPRTISSDIKLASDLLGSGIFGEDELAISHLDRKYSSRNRQEVS